MRPSENPTWPLAGPGRNWHSDEIGIGVLVEPTTPYHELLPEIADVSDRTTEAAHAELRKSQQDLGPGTRIPTIIVSPYAKRDYIDRTAYDTTSIIKFITRRFGLEPLAGARPNAGDLTAAFDWTR